RTLGTPTFPFPAGAEYYGPEHHPALIQLATVGLGISINKKGAYTTTKLWKCLTDIDQLLALRRKRNDKLEAPLIYQIAGKDTEKLSPQALAAAPLHHPVRHNNYFLPKRLRELLRAATAWEGQRADDLSTRLLQIKLWQLHYYEGAIDGDWGPMSHRALVGFIGVQSELERKNRMLGNFSLRQKKTHTLLIPVNRDQGIYVVDFRRLTNRLTNIVLLSEDEAREEENKLFSRLGEAVRGRERQLQRKVLDETGVSNLYPTWGRNQSRRIAYTRRSFLGRIFAGFGRIVDWVKGKVVKFAKRLGGIIFGFVKLLLHKVRTGVQRFFTGFKYLATFLLGKPFFTVMPPNPAGEQLIFATKFQLDFDAVNVVPAGFRREDAVRHEEHIYQIIDGMDYFLQTTIDIIRTLVRLGTPRGWLALGWQIGLAVVRTIFRKPVDPVPV
ncbi:MAG: hypothetical protein AAFZ52_18400, partial [Bacteroidota bacterium]